jgi:hypothetical protein
MPDHQTMPDHHASLLLPAPSRADRNVANASKGHCVAFAVLGDGAGVRMQAESHLELSHLFILNADPEIADLREQVRFRFGPRGAERDHVFDVVATRRDSTRIAYTVKPEVRLASGRFLAEMREVAWWVARTRFAAEVRLLTDADVDPVALHNGRLIAAVREADPEAEAAARKAAAGITGAVSLRDLTVATGLEARGYRALLRLIRTGALETTRREAITPTTLVQRKGDIR